MHSKLNWRTLKSWSCFINYLLMMCIQYPLTISRSHSNLVLAVFIPIYTASSKCFVSLVDVLKQSASPLFLLPKFLLLCICFINLSSISVIFLNNWIKFQTQLCKMLLYYLRMIYGTINSKPSILLPISSDFFSSKVMMLMLHFEGLMEFL